MFSFHVNIIIAQLQEFQRLTQSYNSESVSIFFINNKNRYVFQSGDIDINNRNMFFS